MPFFSNSELAARREEARRRRRRRGLIEAAAAIAVGVAAAAGVAIAASGGSGGPKPHPAAGLTQASQPQPPAKPVSSSRFAAIDAAGRAEIARLAHYGLPVYCGGPHGNEVAFTFVFEPRPCHATS